jgi:hypothetical protein
MTDYQRVVEYLRDVRLQPNKQVTDDLRRFATEFAELCKQANDRLRQCSTFLSQGLRSEAIHLADESPNLLDMVAALDLPEPDAWVEYCQQHDLPVPEQLQMDRAAQLNDAYAQDQPLEHLLNRHRLLALSRAPIKERLDTLRQISAQDPSGTLWEKSIRTFEKARLREMPAEFLSSVKSKDSQAIRSLYTEINQSWLEPVPADLQNGVTEAFGRLQRQGVENSLRELVKPLRSAFAARAYGEAASLVEKWRTILSDGNVTSLSPDISQAIDPVIDWLKEEDELRSRHKKFVAACRSFTGLLDATAPEAELDAAHEKLLRFDEPMPEAIEARYQEVIKKRLDAISRAHRLRLAMVGAAAVVVLLVVAAAIVIAKKGSDAKDWTAKIVKANVDKDFNTALALVAEQEKQAAWLNSDPDLAQAKKQAQQLADDAKRDTVALNDQLKKMADAQAKAAPATAAQNPEELLAALAVVNEANSVSAARNLDWVDTDKKLPPARAALLDLQRQLADKVSKIIADAIDSLNKQLDALPPSAQDDPDLIQSLEAIVSKARAIQDLAGLDSTSNAAIAALLTRADSLEKEYGKHREENEALRKIRTSATTAEELHKALQDFVKRFPDSPLTPDFTTALERSTFDKSVEAWRDLQATWNHTFAAVSGDMAQKRADEVQTYLTNQPGSPLAAQAGSYVTYLKAATDALAPKGTWQSGPNGFGELLDSPLMTSLCVVQTSDNQTYYTLGKNINIVQRRLNTEVTTTFDAIDGKGNKKQIVLLPPVVIAKGPDYAPHSVYAQSLAETVKFIDEKNWETVGIDVIEQLRKNEDLDPVVRATLIEQAVKGTDATSHWALGDTYERALADFTRLKLADIVWFDRDNPVSTVTLASLRHVIAGVPNGTEVKQRLADKKAELFKTLAFDYTSTGVLLKDSQGNWTLQPVGASEGTVAWAVSPAQQVTATAVPAPPAADVTPAPAATDPPTTAPATDPATDGAAPATTSAGGVPAADNTTAAPATPPPPPAPAVTTTLLRVGEFKGSAFVVDPNTAKNLPQGAMVFITKP